MTPLKLAKNYSWNITFNLIQNINKYQNNAKVTLHTEGLWFRTTGWRQWCHRFWSSHPPYREDNDSELRRSKKDTVRKWMILELSVWMRMFLSDCMDSNITWVYLAIDVC